MFYWRSKSSITNGIIAVHYHWLLLEVGNILGALIFLCLRSIKVIASVQILTFTESRRGDW